MRNAWEEEDEGGFIAWYTAKHVESHEARVLVVGFGPRAAAAAEARRAAAAAEATAAAAGKRAPSLPSTRGVPSTCSSAGASGARSVASSDGVSYAGKLLPLEPRLLLLLLYQRLLEFSRCRGVEALLPWGVLADLRVPDMAV